MQAVFRTNERFLAPTDHMNILVNVPKTINKSTKESAKIVILDENYFSEEAEVLFAIGKYLSLAEEPLKARDYIRRAIKLDKRYRKKLLEDKAFDQVWDSFA